MAGPCSVWQDGRLRLGMMELAQQVTGQVPEPGRVLLELSCEGEDTAFPPLRQAAPPPTSLEPCVPAPGGTRCSINAR
ncbi:Ubiquitin-Like Modifier-Activating Enzyme 7 [Manis pentadactyla]|nr:Ubiquitin-Like Modifier-Activating Enzyme 7 [Manis pentadactyla]